MCRQSRTFYRHGLLSDVRACTAIRKYPGGRGAIKTVVLLICIIVLFLLPYHLCAGESFRLEAGGGITFNERGLGVLSNWSDGWTAGIGVAYPVTPAIEIGATVFYHRFPYRGDDPHIAVPAVPGFRLRADGKPTNMYETAVAARFMVTKSFLQPFLSLRAGAYIMHIGDIMITNWLEATPNRTSSSLYHGSGESLTKAFAAIGFGLNVPLDSNLQFKIEGRFTSTLDGLWSFAPVVGTIQFVL